MYLKGLNVEQERVDWTKFSVSTVRAKCERLAFVGRSECTNPHMKCFHCDFFTVHAITCQFCCRMNQEIIAAENTILICVTLI